MQIINTVILSTKQQYSKHKIEEILTNNKSITSLIYKKIK